MKFVTAAFAATLALASSSVFAAQMHCADANSTLKYDMSSYDGGAHPYPEMVVRTERVSVDGELVGVNQHRYLGESTVGVHVDFVDGSRHDLETVSDRNQNLSTTTFSTRLAVTDLEGKVRFQGYVICAESSWIIPPP